MIVRELFVFRLLTSTTQINLLEYVPERRNSHVCREGVHRASPPVSCQIGKESRTLIKEGTEKTEMSPGKEGGDEVPIRKRTEKP